MSNLLFFLVIFSVAEDLPNKRRRISKDK